MERSRPPLGTSTALAWCGAHLARLVPAAVVHTRADRHLGATLSAGVVRAADLAPALELC